MKIHILALLLPFLLCTSLKGADLANSFKTVIASQGYSVSEGKLAAIGTPQCGTLIRVFGSCLGNNPVAPYIVPEVPQIAGEYVDPYYGNTGSRWNGLIPGGKSLSFRLRPDEAIVLIGTTPPTAAYFGYQSYLFTRKGMATPTALISLLALLSPAVTDMLFSQSSNPTRYEQFASVGDAINDVTLAKQIGTASGFSQNVQIVSTADLSLAALIKTSLVQVGSQASRIAIEPLPAQLRMGTGESADDLAILMRYVIPQNAALGNAWRNAPSFRIFRVTKTVPKTSVVRYGPIAYSTASANSEQGLAASLKILNAAVLSALALPSTVHKSPMIAMNKLGLQGGTCISNTMNCLGDSQDTDTYRVGGFAPLGLRDLVVIVGVNTTETKNAKYQTLGVYYSDFLEGVASVNQTASALGFGESSLTGSVNTFFASRGLPVPLLISPNKQKFYVRMFARNCGTVPLCTSVPTSVIPLNSNVSWIQRSYMKMGDSHGANPSDLLSPQITIWNRN